MNGRTETEKRFRLKKGSKLRDALLLSFLALLLVVAIWRIFYADGTDKDAEGKTLRTENEQALAILLEKIDGVGEADVVISEDKNGVKSVVVVCEGASDIRVNIEVREAAAAAVGTEEKNVKVYKMNE